MAKAARKKKAPSGLPGYDGAQTFDAEIIISSTRRAKQVMRARPGTFEWRYARPRSDGALYEAGAQFSVLWERAGVADARSIDWASEGKGGGWRGLPDGRVDALDKVKAVSRELGKLSSRRLALYCVQGMTTSEIAGMFGVPDRSMAAVLHEDLRAAALHFRFL